MVVRGATNPEIAAELDVSLDGAKWHLREIFAKLGVDSREEAADVWRAHHSPRARTRRLVHSVFGVAGMKVAAGAGGVAAIGIAVAVVGLGRPNDPGAEAQPAAQTSPQIEAWVRVEGSSMAPALTDGQRYPLDVLVYVGEQPQRGDIVALVDPRIPGEVIVKRLIGLPGETVQIVDDIVHVNGEPLTEPYGTAGTGTEQRPLILLPEDNYYLLGDNRANSLDSRSPDIGLIPGDLILGKVVLDPADLRGPERHDLDQTPPVP